jgi:hypothetical protein
MGSTMRLYLALNSLTHPATGAEMRSRRPLFSSTTSMVP